MKRPDRQNIQATSKPKSNYLWILGLALFGIIPLLKTCIKDYRYNKEIRPIRDGLIENYKRKEGVIYGDTGRIYILASNKLVQPKYQWYNGYQSMPNDSLYYRIRLQTSTDKISFSRDTTVGQVVCVLIDTKNDSSNNVRIHGIYFKPGSAAFVQDNMNMRLAIIYAGDPGYEAYFVADTFDKDSVSEQGILARQRLQRIRQELVKRKIDSFSIKTF